MGEKARLEGVKEKKSWQQIGSKAQSLIKQTLDVWIKIEGWRSKRSFKIEIRCHSAANLLPRFASKWCFSVLLGAIQCN